MKEDNYKNEAKSEIEELDSLTTLLASLNKDIEIYAIGGTAMVLAGHKPSTRDIDFLTTLKQEDIKNIFTSINLEEIDDSPLCNKWRFNGKRLDIFYDGSGMIMGFPLINGRKENSKLLSQKRKVKVFILDWEDIISTKLARGEPRDFEDIIKIMSNEKIDIEKFGEGFKERAEVSAGNTTHYLENLEELRRRIKNART